MHATLDESDDLPRSDSIFNGVSLRIHMVLRRTIKSPTFVVSLHPTKWSAIYNCLATVSDAETANVLRDKAESLWQAKGLEDAEEHKTTEINFPKFLEDLGKTLSESGKNTPADLAKGAASILENSVTPCGWRSSNDPLAEKECTWVREYVPDRHTEMKLFQDVLNYAHHFDFNHEKARLHYDKAGKQYSFLGDVSKRLVVSAEYEERKGLVNEDNFVMFAAEHFYSLASTNQAESISNGSLCHYFLPLAVLGQWRATICWLGASDFEIHELDENLLNRLYELSSRALVEAFCEKLTQTLLQESKHRLDVPTYERVFADLWWSDRIAFFDEDLCVFEYCRDDMGNLIGSRNQQPAARATIVRPSDIENKFVCISGVMGSDCLTRITLDLRQLPETKARLARDILGFERIEFDARLFNQRLVGHEHYIDALMHSLGKVLQVYELQRRLLYAQALEGIGHDLKNAGKVIGWAYTKKLLEDLPPSEDPKTTQAIHEAIRCLSMHVVFEGIGGRLRLANAYLNGAFDRLGSWINENMLLRWEAGDETVFNRYVWFMSEFTRAVCYGLLHHEGFHYTVRNRDSRNRTVVQTTSPPHGFVDEWIFLKGSLPPFNGDDESSHVTLLSMLIEPLHNSIKALKDLGNKAVNAPAELHLVISNELPEKITLFIGNDINSAMLPKLRELPGGIRLTKHVLELTRLGRILEAPLGPLEDLRDRNMFWLQIDLTPQKFARDVLTKKNYP